jgi:hypothetical protein
MLPRQIPETQICRSDLVKVYHKGRDLSIFLILITVSLKLGQRGRALGAWLRYGTKGARAICRGVED